MDMITNVVLFYFCFLELVTNDMESALWARARGITGMEQNAAGLDIAAGWVDTWRTSLLHYLKSLL